MDFGRQHQGGLRSFGRTVASTMLLVLTGGMLDAAKLPPVDESASEPTFEAFKVRILRAIRNKDVDTLMSILDPNVRVSFGEGAGPAAFRRHWKLDQPAKSAVWNELEAVLRLGATRDDPEFIAPYVFTRFPVTVDAYTHAAVIRPNAILRQTAAPDGRRAAVLAYDIVRLTGERKNGWVNVQTEEGRSGWLQEQEIRSPLNYRAFFEKKDGRWTLTAFVSGD